jgi:single-strand DNA-binding protein
VGGQAVNCAEYLAKGSRVFIDGELDYQEWEDRVSGQKRSTLRVRAQTVTFESPAAARGSRQQPPGPPPAEPRIPALADEGTATADDLPF